jgi:hypothetical protein
VKSGRPIVLSLSPGPSDLAKADFHAVNANLWRAGNDLWDRWQDVRREFDLIEKWSAYARPGAWPDADMLPLGHIGIRAERGDDRETQLTADEQRTLMTLWTIARQPLMFGGDLPSSDDATLALIAMTKCWRPIRKPPAAASCLRVENRSSGYRRPEGAPPVRKASTSLCSTWATSNPPGCASNGRIWG